MKNLVFVVTAAVVSLLPQRILAVETVSCPKSIFVTYEEISAISDRDLVRQVGENKEVFAYLKDTQAAVLREGIPALGKIELKIVRRWNGKCDYTSVLSNAPESRLFTRNGRDILRIAMVAAQRVVWVYYDVIAYSTEGIAVSLGSSTRVLAKYPHPEARDYTIGRAKAVEIY